MKLGEGTKGPIVVEVAAIRVWEVRKGLPGELLPARLFIRRNANGEIEVRSEQCTRRYTAGAAYSSLYAKMADRAVFSGRKTAVGNEPV